MAADCGAFAAAGPIDISWFQAVFRFHIKDNRARARPKAMALALPGSKGDLRGQLFTADLVTGSFAMALYFAVFQAIAAEYFVPYALWGGGVVLAAMLLALLRASRLGLHAGRQRAAFALGSTLAMLGLGGCAPLLFLVLVYSLFNSFDAFLLIFRMPISQPMNHAALYGAMALVAGQGLMAWARWRQGKMNQEPR